MNWRLLSLLLLFPGSALASEQYYFLKSGSDFVRGTVVIDGQEQVFATCEGRVIKPFDEGDLMRTTMKCPSSGPLRSFATISALDPATSSVTFQTEDGATETRRISDASQLAQFYPGQKVWLSTINVGSAARPSDVLPVELFALDAAVGTGTSFAIEVTPEEMGEMQAAEPPTQ
jgi:hypothetical protein